MDQNKKEFSLLKVVLLTGLAFVIGGFFRTFLELTLAREGKFLLIFIAIWIGFLVEAVVGITVLASILRGVYPFKKLWMAGVGAFAAGILVPALIINQFFVILLILPGFLIGLFFSMFLNERSGRIGLILSITLGFLLCQILIYSASNDMDWMIWIYNNIGENSVKILMDIVMNFIIGVSVAVGIGFMVRKLDNR